jgi:hypothetical protein
MNRPAGQAALILILVMMVASTVALTVIQRTIQEIELTTTEAESAKALQAAEAGVEEGLRTLRSGQQEDLEGASYQIQVGTEGSDGYLAAADLSQGNTIQINLQGSPSPPTSLDVYWGDVSDPQESPTGAIEVIKYQQFGAADYRVVHLTFDPDATRRSENNFEAATNSPGSALNVEFSASANVPLVAEDVLVRIRAVYNRALIAVVPQPGGSQLPDQQHRIVSTGQTESGLARRVEVVRDQPSLPQFFDFALYAGSDLFQESVPIPTPVPPSPTPTPPVGDWPDRVTVVYPASVNLGQATLSWDGVDSATYYRIYIALSSDPGTAIYDSWQEAGSIGCSTAPGPCILQPAVTLSADNYSYWIQAWGPGGYNENSSTVWSATQGINVTAPPRVTSFQTTAVDSGYATLGWTGVAQANWYRVYVATTASSTAIYDQWHSTDSMGCSPGTTCSVVTPASFNPDVAGYAGGDYRYWVQAWGPSGYNEDSNTVWSDVQNFNVPFPPIVTDIQPTTVAAGAPTLRWTGVAHATWYRVWVGPGAVVDQWASAVNLGCSSSGQQCTLSPAVTLSPGAYTQYIQAWGPSGFNNGSNTLWSAPQVFNVP